VFIPRIELGQEDVNKTVYAITLEIKGSMGGADADLHPSTSSLQLMDATAPTPEKPLERQDLSSTYYVHV
jgi:hypothetical protein